jgi:hypothetical protein
MWVRPEPYQRDNSEQELERQSVGVKMETCTPPSPLLMFVPLLVASMVIATVANILARQKGRSVVAWTALGAIPFVNFLLAWYFAGAVNLRLEEKLDRIIASLGKSR